MWGEPPGLEQEDPAQGQRDKYKPLKDIYIVREKRLAQETRLQQILCLPRKYTRLRWQLERSCSFNEGPQIPELCIIHLFCLFSTLDDYVD